MALRGGWPILSGTAKARPASATCIRRQKSWPGPDALEENAAAAQAAKNVVPACAPGQKPLLKLKDHGDDSRHLPHSARTPTEMAISPENC